MDLQQSSVHNNSSCRTTSNTAVALAPPLSNLTISTTNTTPTTTSTILNTGDKSASPCTTPNAKVNQNHYHHNHHRNTQSVVTQKSNQVSTVLLYGIPIVSLYIEGQERLCLAQISNTLLKQFSYNEIHNRRVALGITCVQCTPVQLEILRRAGAMPVSSRRCGMITRREAERLCKSFLGDNTPPRLPDDFAFNVQHKCAWGCRGSFLPSRYNSSRAKCIKCHYCGMFFSPNKFIFHSHRIGPSDKYVQPDAANFNSWRRHMMLSGQPPKEVIYAWEDVKAMFNGGTRKRIMTANSSSPIPRVRNSSPSSSSAGTSINSLSGEQVNTIEDDFSTSGEPLIKSIQKVQKTTSAVSAVTAAAAVVGVTAVAVGGAVRPLNLHYQPSVSTGLASESSYSVGTDMHLIPAAALSRSFMMDYMWQHAHQAAKNTYNQHYQHQHQQQQQQKVKGCNSAFTLPWIKATVGTTLESQNQDVHNGSDNKNFNGSATSTRYPSPINTRWANSTTSDITRNLSQIINTSAFKPVLQHQQQAITLPCTRPRRRQSTPELSPVATLNGTASTLSSIIPKSANQIDQLHNKTFKGLFSSDDEHDHQRDDEDDCNEPSSSDEKRFNAADESEALDDDIMVDIETTEDEKPLSFSTNVITSTTGSRNGFVAKTPESNDNDDEVDDVDHDDDDNENSSDEDVIDVVHNDNDDTVLEFSSLVPLTVIEHTKENDKIPRDIQTTFTSPVSLLKDSKELEKIYSVDRLNSIDYSNTENVPPPPLSVSPNYNSNSSCSRSSECFYVQTRGDNSNTHCDSHKNNTTRMSSKSPESNDDQKFNFNAISFEKSHKISRKRSFTKYHDENDITSWKHTDDVPTTVNDNVEVDGPAETSAAETTTKYKKKLVESSTKGAHFFEALTQKYELTYYNNNNSCKSSYSSNNNNNSVTSNNNTTNNNNNNEFWHMARLCMQRPINYEQNQKVQQQQQQNSHNPQQVPRLPTFYYRQQQFILTPNEQQQQQHQQQYTSHNLPASQQVYFQLQQNQPNLQAVQKSQNSANDVSSPPSNSQSSNTPVSNTDTSAGNDVLSTYTNFKQNSHDTASSRPSRANGIG